MSDPDRPNDPDGHATPAPWGMEGPEEASGHPAACEFSPGERSGGPEDAEGAADADLHEPFMAEPIPIVISPVDGMPVPGDDTSDLALAPHFTYQTVCVEDDREYVEVFGQHTERDAIVRACDLTQFFLVPSDGDHPAEWAQSALRRSGATTLTYRPGFGFILRRERFTLEGKNVDPVRGPRADVVRRWGLTWIPVSLEALASLSEDGKGLPEDVVQQPVYVLAEPVRPACRFYKRSIFANDGVVDPNAHGHKIIFRNCEARRTVGGALLSVMNELVYACEFRSPPDPASVEEHVGRRDRDILDRGPEGLEDVPLFNIRNTASGSSSQG